AHAPAEADWLPRQGSHPADPADGGGPVTDKGLPKRTPRTVAAPRREDVRPQPPRRVDAEELRRRLGGFYQGAQDGRRVAAAELAQDLQQSLEQDRGQDRRQDQGQGQSSTDQGDSAQEART
ncbi:histidine kinase, partial [Streptomyces sp. F8]|nr:histidine kinase [Streptomyces sp. F8]